MATAERLALTGGTPVVDRDLHSRWPDVRQEDREAVLAVLDRRVFCGARAPEITALETDWAEYIGVSHCLALNSGTAALHCCVVGAGLVPGDEVIVPAHTFIATPYAVAHAGGVPVFVDIDERTFNIDADLIEERVTERTRAIMPVHLYGVPADMDEIGAIAERHGLAVIEDAAQSHGATYKGRKTGTIGDCGAFSLNMTKNLSGGEGGLFVTDDVGVLAAARRLSNFGEDALTDEGSFRAYLSHSLGWNYRNQELSAAFARSQLRRLDEYNETARRNARILTEGLAEIRGMRPPYIPEDRTSVHHKYRVLVEPSEFGFDGPPSDLRDRLVRALRAEGLECVLWQVAPLPALPAFRRPLEPWHPSRDGALAPWDPQEYPVSSRVLDSSLILGSEQAPLFVQEASLMERYVEAVARIVDRIDEVLAAPLEPVRLM